MKNVLLLLLLTVFAAGCGPQPEQDIVPVNSGVEVTIREEVAPAVSKQEVYLQEGFKHLEKGDFALAVKSFDEVIKQDPSDLTGYMILGQTYMRMQQHSRAIDTFSAAAMVAPDKGEIYYLLAINYGFAGNIDQAKANAEKSIELFHQQKDEVNFKKAIALLHGLVNAEEELE